MSERADHESRRDDQGQREILALVVAVACSFGGTAASATNQVVRPGRSSRHRGSDSLGGAILFFYKIGARVGRASCPAPYEASSSTGTGSKAPCMGGRTR